MKVIENACIVGSSLGEKKLCVIQDVNTGKTITLENSNEISFELGMEGVVTYNAQTAQIVSFEPVMVEEFA